MQEPVPETGGRGVVTREFGAFGRLGTLVCRLKASDVVKERYAQAAL